MPSCDEWLEILPDDASVISPSSQPSSISGTKSGQARAVTRIAWIERADRALVGAALDRRAGADHADVAVPRRRHRRGRARAGSRR